jgi:SRSO17 transposase
LTISQLFRYDGGVKWNEKLWKKHLEEFRDFMTPLVSTMGRSERRTAATRYVEGLLLPGERKSIEPMAARLGVEKQKLTQFVSDSPWNDEPVWSSIRREVIPHLEPIEAWVVDETGWLKQGTHSVGVSHQYCGAVGKQANCQVSVEVVVSDGWIAAPIGGRLYLPKSWADHPERCAGAKVPADIQFATKSQLALPLIQQALADGVPPAPILGDSAYGDSAEFREQLRQWKLEFFLQVTPSEHKGWTHEVKTELKRTRRHVDPQAPPAQSLEQLTRQIPPNSWKDCKWVSAGGKTRRTRLAWMEVFLPGGLERPGGQLERVWLVVDWPKGAAEPYHYYLAHFHKPPSRARSLKLSRSRWHVEQYFQRGKTDLGLDHFEGRSWQGFHHHLVLSALAYLFVQTVYLRYKKNFWCDVGTDSPLDAAIAGEIQRVLSLLPEQI